jgi:hypothetical protein
VKHREGTLWEETEEEELWEYRDGEAWLTDNTLKARTPQEKEGKVVRGL